MDYKAVGVGVVATLLLVGSIGAGAVFVQSGGFQANDSGHDHSAHSHTEPATTSQPVDENEVPDRVKKSLDGAKLLKQKLGENGFENASVQINRRGEVIVHYTSQAANGPELKEEMTKVAVLYAEAVGVHNETGGLTVAANGVKLMVSSDAAEAHADGRLKKSAYKQTFHWSSYKHHTEAEGSN